MSDEKKPITPPAEHINRDMTRAITEGLAELIPGAGILTNSFRITHPPKSATAVKEWQEIISTRANELSEQVNKHEDYIHPKETIAGTTAELISALCEDCPDGLGRKYYDISELQSLLPNKDINEIEESVYELANFGVVDLDKYLGGGYNLRLSFNFYEQFDLQILGFDTVADAKQIAQFMLSENTGRAVDLLAKTGWEKRRFNPAFRYILSFFPSGRISRTLDSEFASPEVLIAPEDKVKLRRFTS